MTVSIAMAMLGGFSGFTGHSRGRLLMMVVTSAGLDSSGIGYRGACVIVTFVAWSMVGSYGDGSKESEAGHGLDHCEKTVFFFCLVRNVVFRSECRAFCQEK